MTTLSKRDALIHRHTNIRGEQNDEDEKTDIGRKEDGSKKDIRRDDDDDDEKTQSKRTKRNEKTTFSFVYR